MCCARQANKSPMGSSLVGFKGNETKFKVIIQTELLKLFFPNKE